MMSACTALKFFSVTVNKCARINASDPGRGAIRHWLYWQEPNWKARVQPWYAINWMAERAARNNDSPACCCQACNWKDHDGNKHVQWPVGHWADCRSREGLFQLNSVCWLKQGNVWPVCSRSWSQWLQWNNNKLLMMIAQKLAAGHMPTVGTSSWLEKFAISFEYNLHWIDYQWLSLWSIMKPPGPEKCLVLLLRRSCIRAWIAASICCNMYNSNPAAACWLSHRSWSMLLMMLTNCWSAIGLC